MDNFCKSQFWDWNTTWNTNDPDFTPCFENTILIWIPCAFLWLCSFIDIYFFSSSYLPQLHLTRLHFCKCFCNVAILLLSIFPILHNFHKRENESGAMFLANEAPVVIYACIIKISTFILALILLNCDRIKGYRSSGILFIFWLLFSTTESIVLRTVIRNSSETKIFLVARILYCSFIYILFLLNWWADNSSPLFHQQHSSLQEQDEDNPYPEINSSFISRLTFTWVGSIIALGYKRPLKFDDLWDLRLTERTQHNCSQFLKHCKRKESRRNEGEEEKQKKDSDGWFFDLLVPIFRTFWVQYITLGALKLSANIFWLGTPKLLSLLIDFVKGGPSEHLWKGYLFAVLIFLLSMLRTFAMQQCVNLSWITAYRMKAALSCAIYRKSLLISATARKGASVGEIVNLMSVDVDKVMNFSTFSYEIISSTTMIILVTYFLHEQLGLAAFAGISTMFCIIPINIVVVKAIQKLQRSQMKKKDERVKIMNEILSGVKIIKMYAWEPSFVDLVGKIRNEEIKLLKLKAYIQAFYNFIWKLLPFCISLTSFTTYILIDRNNALDPQKAFVSLALFNLLIEPLNCLFGFMTNYIDCLVSLKRIKKFLNSAEKDDNAVIRRNATGEEGISIKIENGDFAWENGGELILKNINIQIKKGSLVAIVGAVGSGKSSILEAILGEMRKVNGNVEVAGNIAYVSQLPYIRNATLEKNVTFGMALDREKYENIIDCCALRPDLDILPSQDQTEIGEKGINLSGGQKQRVSLARAAYNNADVYLLDDPLSAVDCNVGKHIFKNLIGPEGLLKDKTRVLVTHGISYLPYVDQILVLKDGEISECGVYAELLEKKGSFSDFLIQFGAKNINEEETQNCSKYFEKSIDELVRTAEEAKRMAADKLIEEEKSETGNVKMRVFKNYIKYIGWLPAFGILFSFTALQGFSVGGNLWLAHWSKGSEGNLTEEINGNKPTVLSQDVFLAVYGVLGLGQGIFIFAAACYLYLGTLNAANKLHYDMLMRIVKAPMSFFDTTPLGRIINRFGADVQTLDQDVPSNMIALLSYLFQILAILFVSCLSNPMFLVVIALISPIFIVIQRYFAAASRQLFRLNSISRSPIFSHFSETLNGVTTIRAFEAQERFIEECETTLDNMIKTFVPLTTSRWLALRLQTLGSIFIFVTALFAVIARNTVSPSIVGLTISYSLLISHGLLYCTMYMTFFEMQIVSAERIMEYTEIDQEDEWKHEEKRPDSTWPQNGAIEFINYQTRYREGTNLVLNGISCEIQPGEKIGIVGRTGAGKSSITLGLFRIIEATNGYIFIDGEDISKLGLHDVRGRLTIIPQDPVLFSGTLRFNLDPFNCCDDTELWVALEHSHLKTFVQDLPAGLNHEILETGGNLSMGQRQLVCLARALLRKCKILVLDEATASVDLETDGLIQNTIRTQFQDCTVITIAHRLNTIMDSNRIIVLAQGDIVEFDTPSNLLANSSSQFYDMAQSAGII